MERLSPEEALQLYREDDFFGLGRMAQAVRFAHNPERTVTYTINRNINYTNICNAGCRFCAFSRKQEQEEAYVLQKEDFFPKMDELLAVGGTEVLLQGGHHDRLPLSYYTDLLSFLGQRYSQVTLHAFSPPEIVHLAKRVEKTSIRNVLEALYRAGLRTIPGGGADILVDRVRQKMTVAKCSTGEWLEVMETAHALGIGTTATMMFGHLETVADRIEHLQRLRDLQDRTGGFRAFIPWTFQDKNTFWQGKVKALRGSYDYLKTVAIARIFLDNFPHVQASSVTQSLKVGQVALHFGADDMGGTMLEENVVRMAGADEFHTNEPEIRRVIEEAGFIPKQRDTFYRIVEKAL